MRGVFRLRSASRRASTYQHKSRQHSGWLIVNRDKAMLNNPFVKRCILHSKHTSSVGSLLTRHFSTPKGFGNFYPRKDSNNSESEESESPPKPASPASDSTPEQKPSTAGATSTASTSSTSEPKPSQTEDSEDPQDDEKQDNKNKKEDDKKQKAWSQLANLLAIAIPLAILLLPSVGQRNDENEITFQQFKTFMLEQGRVDHIEVINKSRARVYLRKDNMQEGDDFSYSTKGTASGKSPSRFSSDKVYWWNIGSVETFETKLEQAQLAMGIDSVDWVPVSYVTEMQWTDVLMKGPLLYLLLFAWAAWFFNRRATEIFEAPKGLKGGGGGGMGGLGNIFSITKANVTVINKGEKVKTRFKDVAGLEQAKEEVMEFVKFLQNPKQYTRLGAKIPQGALLVGPPGTGKTLLAKATAGEAKCPFFSISGSDFIEMFVGVGPSRVRDLFQQARANAPCIVFIDEIDAVGRKRGKGGWGGGNDERENTLNQLLVEMDGFTSTANVVVLAGTNRADILDEALTRPGRFDRQIQIDKPDIKGRVEIFNVHLSKIKLALPQNDVASRCATLTPGMSGADIANVVNEAALRAARLGKEAVEIADFYAAVDRIIGGLEKRSIMTPAEREMIAHHEAGHAVCGWFLEHADPLLKVTIVPRGGGALGFAQYLPKELQLYRQEQLNDMMCMTLGGRAAEQIFYGRVSTGASDDLNKVTKLAYGQISIYGMNDGIGQLSFPPEQNQEGLQAYKPYSEMMAEKIDKEAMELVAKSYDRTLKLLTEKKDFVGKLAKALLAKDTLGHDDLIEVLGERPYKNAQYQEYLASTNEFKEKHGQNIDTADTLASESDSSKESQSEGVETAK